jgi:hypothetical protein
LGSALQGGKGIDPSSCDDKVDDDDDDIEDLRDTGGDGMSSSVSDIIEFHLAGQLGRRVAKWSNWWSSLKIFNY